LPHPPAISPDEYIVVFNNNVSSPAAEGHRHSERQHGKLKIHHSSAEGFRCQLPPAAQALRPTRRRLDRAEPWVQLKYSAQSCQRWLQTGLTSNLPLSNSFAQSNWCRGALHGIDTGQTLPTSI
jgi:hypothetical protein